MNSLKWLILLPAFVVGILLLAPVALVAAVLASGAAFTTWAARSLRPAPESVPWQEMVEYAPEVGWRLRPDLDVFGRADDVFHLTTGPDGWRGTVSLDEADMVVFGDSYAFGHGADDHRMYTAFAGDLRIKPIGSDGYDMVQALMWMERYGERLAGKQLVWFVYYGNDLWENLQPTMGHYRKPFVRSVDEAGWQVVHDHVTAEPWPFPTGARYHERLAEICGQTAQAERAFAACEYLIQRAHRLAVHTGAQLAVVGVPDRVQITHRGRQKLQSLAVNDAAVDPDRPDRELDRICQKLEIPFAPLSRHLDPGDYLLQDIHWRTSGHRKVGEILRSIGSETTTAIPARG